MAEMIPDRLPNRASAGEKKVFSILQKLPDDYIVYYEPIIENRYPDFIIICPDLGILIIEVKGWYSKDILGGDLNTVLIKTPHMEGKCNHPIRQARDYMLSLMDKCRESINGRTLIHNNGEFQNKFIFPFGNFVVLSNITSTQIKNHDLGDLSTIFPSSKVVTRDIIEEWDDDSFSGEELQKAIQHFFDPFWNIKRLTENQINVIRAIIHPEIIITQPNLNLKNEVVIDKTSKESSLKVLDLKQENNARKIGDGHRIIYGVAGSGKTILLTSKAKLLSSQDESLKILFLCYNVTLSAYLSEVLTNYQNVTVKHFDGWAKSNGITRKKGEQNEHFGNRLLQKLEKGCEDSRKYDVILIDEAQDFDASWFKCVLAAMVDQYDGDLIIVGDGSQGLYPRKKISWKDIGINAQGRTIYKKFDLDKNYRNSREIIELALIFSESSNDDEDSIISIQVDPIKCPRSTGIMPVLIKSKNRQEECDVAIQIVKNLLDGKWFGKDIEPINPQNIGILYPLAAKYEKRLLINLVYSLQELAPAKWLNQDKFSRTQVSDESIKIQTIHSAKGLQYQSVILLWADHLPKTFVPEPDIEADKKLLYVGLTRPEDYLVISASGSSDFISRIEGSRKVVCS
jgi:hypothetical protein